MGGCCAGPSAVVRQVRGWEGAESESGGGSFPAPGCVTAFRYVLWCRLPSKGENRSLPVPPWFCTVASPKASARVTAREGRGTRCVAPDVAGLRPRGSSTLPRRRPHGHWRCTAPRPALVPVSRPTRLFFVADWRLTHVRGLDETIVDQLAA